MTMFRPNIVLIGMPGVGKSTVGVLLAKALSLGFVDTDLVVQAREGRRLQEIIDEAGIDAFRVVEERDVMELECVSTVIATGGSVPYSSAAMAHLKEAGVAVFLDLPFKALRDRITNMDSRGIAIAPGQTFEDLYRERLPLYKRHADVTIDCRGLNHEQTVAAIVSALKSRGR